MSISSWKKSLATILATAPDAPNRLPVCTIVGIGNEFKGDDAAGLLVARSLIESLNHCASQSGMIEESNDSSLSFCNTQIIEAGTAPENFTGLIRRHSPRHVLMIDAAVMGLPPGSIAVMDASAAEGFGASTHLQPLSTLARFMVETMDCQVTLIGIQPKATKFGMPLSHEVRSACKALSDWLVDFIKR